MDKPMIITDSSMLKCEKCRIVDVDRAAISNVGGVWLCCEHLNDHIKKETERKRKLILEE